MSNKKTSYNEAGPECPACGFVFTPDDPLYYDTMRYTEEQCPECEAKFTVSVDHSVSWDCELIEKETTP